MFALLFLSPLFYYLPNSSLGAVVVVAVISLIDIEEPQRLFKYHWRDLFTLIVAFTITFGWGLEWGVLASLASSFLNLLVYVIRPPIKLLGRVETNDGRDLFLPLPEAPNKYLDPLDKLLWYQRAPFKEEPVPLPGGIIFRLEAPLYFCNVSHTFTTLVGLERAASEKGEKLEWVIVDMKNVTDIDATAIEILISIIQLHKRHNIWFVFADVNTHTLKVLTDSGCVPKHLSPEVMFPTVEAALQRRLQLNKAPLSDDRVLDQNYDQKGEARHSNSTKAAPWQPAEMEMISLKGASASADIV